jgi:hypothetical protein
VDEYLAPALQAERSLSRQSTGTGLHCEPLLTRVDAIEHAKPRIPA